MLSHLSTHQLKVLVVKGVFRYTRCRTLRHSMDQKRLQDLLESLGMREAEAKVYLAALAKHPRSVLDLARTSGVKRTTIYSILETLKARGLVSIEMKGERQRIRAESPEQLEVMLEVQRERLDRSLPDLLSLYHMRRDEQAIVYYDNVEAIKAGYREVMKRFKAGDTYRVISHAEDWYNMDPEFFQKFLNERKKAGVLTRILLMDSPKARELKRFEKNYYEEARLLPAGTKLSTNLLITPDSVLVQQVRLPIFGLRIENPSLIQMHREMFDLIWKKAAPAR